MYLVDSSCFQGPGTLGTHQTEAVVTSGKEVDLSMRAMRQVIEGHNIGNGVEVIRGIMLGSLSDKSAKLKEVPPNSCSSSSSILFLYN